MINPNYVATLENIVVEHTKRIAELEKELATSTPPPNLIWFDRSEVLGLDPEQTGVIDLRGMKLEQQANALSDAHKVIIEHNMFRSARDYIKYRAAELLEMSKALKEQVK